ncbi:MAG: ATP-dependent helicase C-terminal domain-containing protein [Vicinamibacterales bacterium]
MQPLPIDERIAEIRSLVDRHRALVLVAPPGAGKTTRVPPALLSAGPAIVLQPRRAAARAIAARIAAEQRWTLGEEVGWHVRFERKYTPRTRLILATEGILTARLQTDPLATDFATIVLDEFHERSIHADVAVALAKQALRARDDLRLVVMSATIDAERVSGYLDGCPVVMVPGITHPLRVEYSPATSTCDAVLGALRTTEGGILCFEPGAGEIAHTVATLRSQVPTSIEILSLHGGLAPQEQDRALTPSSARRVVVATNIAETSVTVPGVAAVVDGGLEKVARYDHQRAIDSLTLERISAASADQRAGRAARTGPGVAWRLWDKRDRLTTYRAPDILRVDLAAVALDILAWGGEPQCFDWFEAPRAQDLAAALDLLERLGTTHAGRLTSLGARIARMPLPPRLARIAIAGGGDARVLQAVALLADGSARNAGAATTTCDLLTSLDAWSSAPERTRRTFHELQRSADQKLGPESTQAQLPPNESALRAALFAGYPDRLAMRREAGSPRFALASGTGAVLSAESGVRNAQFIVALEVSAGSGSYSADGRIHLASAVEREWITDTTEETEYQLDDSGTVRAKRVVRYGALRLSEHPLAPDPDVATSLLAEAWLAQDRTSGEMQLLRRLAFAQCVVDLKELARAAALGVRALRQLDIATVLSREQRIALDRHAPETLLVPSGRRIRLEYQHDGSVLAAVKLQELFGLAETPRLGPGREPVLLSLLAPNGRPVQLTRDLRSFWDRTYPEVRKELRGRYPKHPWPEDPYQATPTHRAKPRGSA